MKFLFPSRLCLIHVLTVDWNEFFSTVWSSQFSVFLQLQLVEPCTGIAQDKLQFRPEFFKPFSLTLSSAKNCKYHKIKASRLTYLVSPQQITLGYPGEFVTEVRRKCAAQKRKWKVKKSSSLSTRILKHLIFQLLSNHWWTGSNVETFGWNLNSCAQIH